MYKLLECNCKIQWTMFFNLTTLRLVEAQAVSFNLTKRLWIFESNALDFVDTGLVLCGGAHVSRLTHNNRGTKRD